MKVFYKCGCMAAEAEIDVPARRPLAPLGDWMNCMSFCVSADHTALSPHCKSRTMEYVKVPVEGDGLGVKGEPNG